MALVRDDEGFVWWRHTSGWKKIESIPSILTHRIAWDSLMVVTLDNRLRRYLLGDSHDESNGPILDDSFNLDIRVRDFFQLSQFSDTAVLNTLNSMFLSTHSMSSPEQPTQPADELMILDLDGNVRVLFRQPCGGIVVTSPILSGIDIIQQLNLYHRICPNYCLTVDRDGKVRIIEEPEAGIVSGWSRAINESVIHTMLSDSPPISINDRMITTTDGKVYEVSAKIHHCHNSCSVDQKVQLSEIKLPFSAIDSFFVDAITYEVNDSQSAEIPATYLFLDRDGVVHCKLGDSDSISPLELPDKVVRFCSIGGAMTPIVELKNGQFRILTAFDGKPELMNLNMPFRLAKQ